MSAAEYTDDDEDLDDEESKEIEKSIGKKTSSGINPEARRRLEEYYERKSLKQDLEDDLFSDYDLDE